MNRPYNFSAGPAAIPAEVLEQAAAEMLDWHGSGMGVMEMCGALSGMAMIIGLDNSQGGTEEGSRTKGDTYKKIRSKVEKFKEKNGSCICRELKGVETGKVLCSCPQCIADAVALTEEYLAEQGK